ncbi:zinc finger protein 800 isoform X3 [Haemorhous mexicanus]|uniref:zinc finger protein 800 isoform X3 n=1 Tax=Haemorhous mexicanus TaxID=30427 RepID=UPI0028BD2F53|nr:zinc finger protein 800 isoform X3 [Haemorhous mexicanus]
MPLRDKCCQTDHHHHGCCEPVHLLEPGDPPLLQQPLQTSKSGIQQIIECFRSGTKQLKHILLRDVDTIFECKLCRSLFRGLPNLITHKKFYCPPSLQMDDNLPDTKDKQSQAINDLLEAIYPRVDKQEYIITLEPIETNQNAVFQYVSRTDSPDENTEGSHTPDQAPVQIQEPSTEQPKSVSAPAPVPAGDTVELPPADPVTNKNTPEEQPPANELKGTNHSNEKKNAPSAQKNKVKQDPENPKSTSKSTCKSTTKSTPKSTNASAAGGQQKAKKPKLSAGFDFKQLYCKLCKRQFTSKQNLTKHIELHTDGNNIYVKYYRCPLCSYETRRKRDVIRHITVVHKKSPRYLGKITASLEIRAIKKPIDLVLNKVTKRGSQKDETKQIGSKQDVTSNSPNKKYEGADVGIEVKVTKNFSLHRCNKCGKAFARKAFLEHHKKTHKANVSHSPEESKTKGRSTRSKAVVW